MRSCVLVLLLALAACATQPADNTNPVNTAGADRSGAQALRPGEAAVRMNGSLTTQVAYTRSH